MFPRNPTQLGVERSAQAMLTVGIGSCEPGTDSQTGASIELIGLSRSVDGMERIEKGSSRDLGGLLCC